MIITNDGEQNIKPYLFKFGRSANKIKIVTAFFSDTEFILDWLDDSKQIDLLISLRPPTNYYSLKAIQAKAGLSIKFLGKCLHSKFFIFYSNENSIACMIGSSNFTSGGLYKNIETNAILTEAKYLSQIGDQFDLLWDKSYDLQPTDLDRYKKVFDEFQKNASRIDNEQVNFENELFAGRTHKRKSVQVGKKAKRYLAFWKVVNEVRDFVGPISEQEYPGIPVYIAIDHFWHWIKVVWSKEGRPAPTVENRSTTIPKLFKEYTEWDKKNQSHTQQMAHTSKNIFSKLLSQNNIDNLTTDNAKEIYRSLHSGSMRSIRFDADEKFVTENSIENIKTSLKYLLYSNDELTLRIDNLCKESPYKLNQLKSSGAQELIGWVSPEKYPMRNDKADAALSLLGISY